VHVLEQLSHVLFTGGISTIDFIQASMHNLPINREVITNIHTKELPEDNTLDDSDKLLINATKATSKTKQQHSDIRREIGNISKRLVNFTQLQNIVPYHKSFTGQLLSLVGRDAMVVLLVTMLESFCTGRTVDNRGINNHKVTDIDNGTAGGVIT
jgi:hypothetical protein